MPTPDGHRLFKAIVLMGVSLTGGAGVLVASGGAVASCGGSVSAGAVDAHYADISVNPQDGYSHIGFNGDAYGQISIDAQSVDGSQGDAHYDVIATDAATADAPDAPECYPCIAPAGWDS